MKFAAGGSLAKPGRLCAAAASCHELMAMVARAVQYAHIRGICIAI
jgi:hypothetical protein